MNDNTIEVMDNVLNVYKDVKTLIDKVANRHNYEPAEDPKTIKTMKDKVRQLYKILDKQLILLRHDNVVNL